MLSDLLFKQDFLTAAECQQVIDYGNTLELERGKWGYVMPEVNTTMKIAKEGVVDREHPAVADIIARVDEKVKALNDTSFEFDVDFNSPDNKVIFEKLLGDEKGFVSTHTKVNWLSKKSHNKIFATILLSGASDFEGGEFLMTAFYTTLPSILDRRQRGNLMVFPCFKITEIIPVLSGTRYALTFMYTGNLWK